MATTAAHAAGGGECSGEQPGHAERDVGATTVGSVSPGSGTTAGGTAVTITGTNFVSGASSYPTITVTEWTGLAKSNVFDVDGGAASSAQVSSLSI